jgi:signal transduction histidine kinase
LLKKDLTYLVHYLIILQLKRKGPYNTLFSGRAKEVGVISTILIIVISYGLFFYQANLTEENVRNGLFVEQKNRQIESTEAMAQHIGSDLSLVASILQGLADSSYLQQGELYGDRVDKLMRERFDQINNITKVDGLFITDGDDIITYNIVTEGHRSFVNIDISFLDYVQKTRETLRPVFSNGFKGIDGIYRIAVTFPIVDRENGQYIGMVGVQIPTIDFFARYGNVYSIGSQYLAALDRNSVHLIHPVKSFLGTPFFGNHAQEATGHNKFLNDLIRKVMSGKSGSAIYEFKNGERLTTGYPVIIEGKPEYFVFIITPTSYIYAHVNEVLFTERLKMFSLVAGSTAAIVVLIVFLIKWNNILDRQVKRRTKELEESNEQLRAHDKMQKEFINIAAHELRTPIQPIISSSDVLLSKIKDSKYRELLDIVSRNANRLRRLAEDILDVSKIDSHSLLLHKEHFNINEVIGNIVQGYQNQVLEGQNKVRSDIEILFTPKEDVLLVEADKGRLAQVISNLLDNSLKFTKPTIRIRKEGDGEGDGEEKEKITVTTERKDNQVTVSIKDTGAGIHPEILPRLFTKFASKSFAGTGLGLYISKSIIEEHGGKIWAENNSDGRGATFSFAIPKLQPYPDSSGEIEE